MEIIKIENLSFTYPLSENKALANINLSVFSGDFITVCGKSGCGKTTLLRLLKPTLSPHGEKEGNILFCGQTLDAMDLKEQASKIGFVMQNPDSQIVTDKVWHELAFGLESLGVESREIRARVSEMASFFGIESWFHKKVSELSGGQKQLLNLASVMVMQPEVLILDEPTSQLDPIAATEFLKTLERINQEIGTTVILTEHRLEEAFPVSNRVVVMEKGEILACDVPEKTGKYLKNHDMYEALPTPIKIHLALCDDEINPVSVREGRNWFLDYSKNIQLKPFSVKQSESDEKTVIELKNVYFTYDKNLPDVVRDFDVKISKGELFAILGGNGTGKSTVLSIISGLNKPYRGDVLINGQKLKKISGLYRGVLGVMPQNPENLFVKKTIIEDLFEMLDDEKITKEEKNKRVEVTARLCRIEELLQRHPYDISGGEKQRAALAKLLLKNPEILLLDEPTKGMDASFKIEFAEILGDLKKNGVTVLMVSHDIEFCAEFVDRCGLMFDGSLVSVGKPREFFAGKNFYTTAANRMAREVLPEAVLAEDVILACGGTRKKRETVKASSFVLKPAENKEKKKFSKVKFGCGVFFLLLFLITVIWGKDKFPTAGREKNIFQFITIIEMFLALLFFIPQKELGISNKQKKKTRKKAVIITAVSLLIIFATIFTGFYFLNDRKYYFISLLVILEAIIPFMINFESKKPGARELVLISVICALGVAGRAAFFMIPQFKPVLAIIILTGVVFGGETGFLVGALTGFVSNFFFGQGPWTPWQMMAFGMSGFLAGVIFKSGLLPKKKFILCVFGALTTILIYGVTVNLSMVLIVNRELTFELIASTLLLGLPFDVIHAASTVFFLWFLAEPMTEKLERVKIKYGVMN